MARENEENATIVDKSDREELWLGHLGRDALQRHWLVGAEIRPESPVCEFLGVKGIGPSAYPTDVFVSELLTNMRNPKSVTRS